MLEGSIRLCEALEEFGITEPAKPAIRRPNRETTDTPLPEEERGAGGAAADAGGGGRAEMEAEAAGKTGPVGDDSGRRRKLAPRGTRREEAAEVTPTKPLPLMALPVAAYCCCWW